ncbi:MAG TPA: hypothetical protein EYG93_01565 [Sulfurospirillum arcachonense]|nr:hypothetical protein [Sulfurospirillum arcachonense]HIP44008.1 hypothetical protein [Sulfurospirillum arcachonense]
MAKIDSIVRISGGVLLNTPSVDSIEDIKISSKNVKRGDLFIDVNGNTEEIEEAVQNGAYCILTALIPKISDEEIAWVSVKDLEKSLIKLARFYAVEKNFRFIPLLDVQYALAKSLHVEEKAKLLSNFTFEALMQILKSEKETLFFVVKNSFIQNVDPTIKKIKSKIEPDKIFENGLFHSSFIYKDKFVKEVRLSSFFIPYLCSLIEYFDQLKINYKIDNFNNFEHFYPQFVTSKLEISDFGTTRRVIIFESEIKLYNEELEYLYKKVDKKLIVTEINELKTKDFRYALIHGKKEDFEELLQEKKTVQMELF